MSASVLLVLLFVCFVFPSLSSLSQLRRSGTLWEIGTVGADPGKGTTAPLLAPVYHGQAVLPTADLPTGFDTVPPSYSSKWWGRLIVVSCFRLFLKQNPKHLISQMKTLKPAAAVKAYWLREEEKAPGCPL